MQLKDVSKAILDFRPFFGVIQGLSLGPKFDGLETVLFALHDINDTDGLRILVLHCQKWNFSGVFVISHWDAVAATQVIDMPPPAIYACAHLLASDTLPTSNDAESSYS